MTTDPRALIVAGASALGIVATCWIFVVLTDTPAHDATVNVPQSVITRPVSKPGPPVPEHVAGDGTFVVGKQIKAASYRTAGGPHCWWARLDDLRGLPSSIRDWAPAPTWTQVDLVDGVVGLETHGCAAWVMVR